MSFITPPNYEVKKTYNVLLKVSSDIEGINPAEKNITISIVDKFETISNIGNKLLGSSTFFGLYSDISDDGTIMALASPYATVNNSQEGKVDIYEFNSISNEWSLRGNPILANQANALCCTISMSSNGNILSVVDKDFDDLTNGIANVGRVRLFEFNPGSGNYELYGTTSHFLGSSSVSRIQGCHKLNANGNIFAIGYTSETGLSGESNMGAVRLFEFASGTWTQKGQTLRGDTSFLSNNENAMFGQSCALSNDGLTFAVSAPANNLDTGYVQVYKYESAAWVLKKTFIGGESGKFFGYLLDLNSDGTIIAIGITDQNSAPSNPLVKVFEFKSNTWTQLGTSISKVDDDERLLSGIQPLDLSSDGLTLAVSAPYFSSSRGQARLYKFQKNEDWVRFTGVNDLIGEANSDFLGPLSLTDNGSIVLINAPYNDDSGPAYGNVNVYRIE